MQDSCHAVLKQYASYLGVTLSAAMYEAGRQRIHSHATKDPNVMAILDMHGKKLDPRAFKSCHGPKCWTCVMFEQCKSGEYKGTARNLNA